MSTAANIPPHYLYYRPPDAEQWRLFAYFDDITEDECEELRKIVRYIAPTHWKEISEQIGEGHAASYEESDYEFQCLRPSERTELQSNLESDREHLERLAAGRISPIGGDIDTLVLRSFALKRKSQAQSAVEPTGTEPTGSPLDELNDPVTCVWVCAQVGKKAGRPDAFAEKMKRRNYPIVKSACKNYCQRKDAIAMFSSLKHRLLEKKDTEP